MNPISVTQRLIHWDAAATAVDIEADPSDPSCYSLATLRCCSLLLGAGCVMSELEELVMGLTVGAAAQRR